MFPESPSSTVKMSTHRVESVHVRTAPHSSLQLADISSCSTENEARAPDLVCHLVKLGLQPCWLAAATGFIFVQVLSQGLFDCASNASSLPLHLFTLAELFVS